VGELEEEQRRQVCSLGHDVVDELVVGRHLPQLTEALDDRKDGRREVAESGCRQEVRKHVR
jgi:hypothetical protein